MYLPSPQAPTERPTRIGRWDFALWAVCSPAASMTRKNWKQIREDLSTSSKAQDRAAREFFDVLLGKRNQLESARLGEIISRQQEDIDRLKKRVHQQEEELAEARRRGEKVEIRAMSSQN